MSALNKNFIGIFWIYENKIFAKTQNLDEVKSINGFKDSDLSHYQVWDKIKNKHPKFYFFEYEDIPRGRIVYDVNKNRFIIYCNENILQDKISKKIILKKFDLINGQAIFKADSHYKIIRF